MNKYKKNIIARIYMLSFVVLGIVSIGIYDVFFANSGVRSSVILGFQYGFMSALCIVTLLLIFHYKKVIGNEEKLQLFFNQENDERMKAIRAKAGIPMLLITSAIMIFVAIVFSYFNAVIFFTLIVVATCQLLIAFIVKFFTMRRM